MSRRNSFRLAKPSRRRPALEQLEDRVVPATVKWTGTAMDNLWTTPANWSSNAVPGSTDDVVIDISSATPITVNSGANAINSLNDGTIALSITGGSLSIANPAPSVGTASVIKPGVTLSGGTLTANTALKVPGPYTQTGGTLNGTGAVTLGDTANPGTTAASWSGGTMAGAGSTVTTTALAILTAASAANSPALDARALTIQAGATLKGPTFLEAGDTATIDNQATFDIQSNAGIETNNLVAGGAALTNEGTFQKSGGGGTSRIDASFSGSGNVNANSGTLSFNGGGTEVGTFTANATLGFDGGTFNLNSGITVGGPGTVRFGNNGGTVNVNNNVTIGDSGTSLLLFAGGTTTFKSGSFLFTLSGSAQFSGGSTTFNSGSAYYIPGTTTVNGGTAIFKSGSSFSGLPTLVISSGSISFSTGQGGGIGASSLTQSGGTLTGSDTVTVSGATSWTGGTESGSGKTVAALGLSIVTQSDTTKTPTLDHRTFNNNTTGTLTGPGFLEAGNGATLNNASSLDIQTDAGIETGNTVAGTATLNNTGSGTLMKSAGTGTSRIDAILNNASGGVVQANSGTLSFDGGGTEVGTLSAASGDTLGFDGGTFNFNNGATVTANGTVRVSAGTVNVNSGATLNGGGTVLFSGGSTTVAAGSTYNVTGTTTVTGGTVTFPTGSITTSVGALTVSGGTFTFQAGSKAQNVKAVTLSGGTVDFSSGNPVTAASLKQSGGTLTGSDTVTVNGLLTWTGGTMSGSGVTLAKGGIAISGSGDETLDTRTLTNNGSATWAGANNTIHLLNGAVWNNAVGSVLDSQADGQQMKNDGGTAPAFNNQGTFKKSAGSGSTTIGVPFSNGGTVQATSGTLDFTGGVSNFASNTLTGGAWIVHATLQFTGANIQTDAATIVLDGASSAIIDENSNDALAGLAAITSTGSLVIQNGRNLTTTAALTSSGNITVGAGTTLTAASPLTLNGGTLTGAGTVADNVVNAGAHVAPGLPIGVLTIMGNYTQQSGGSLDIDLTGTTAGTQYDQLVVTGAATLAGTINVNRPGGFSPASGNTFQVLNFGSSSGDFATHNGFYLGNGLALTEQFAADHLSLVAGPATLVFQATIPDIAAGATFAPVHVAILDANSNVIPDNTGQVTLTINQNTLLGTLAEPVVNGVATFSDLSINKAASGYKITAAVPGLSATSNLFTVNPATATQLVYLQPPTNELLGSPITPDVKVAIEDKFNNVETGDSATQVTLSLATNPSSASLTGATNPATVAAGVATFTGLQVSKLGIGYTLQADGGGLPSLVSAAFNVTAPNSSTALTSSLNPSYAGIPVTFTATVTGPGGTPGGTVTFLDNGVALGSAVTLSAGGVATFTTSTLAGGAHFITAAYSGNPLFPASTSAVLLESVQQALKTGDVVVEQVGTPGAAGPATGTAAPIVLAEYGPTAANQATPVNSVGLPLAGTGGSTPNALTTAYGDALQGLLHLSINGAYLALAGYNAAPGTANVAATSTTGTGAVVRVVGRIDGNGNVDTTTSTTDYSGQPVFAAGSADGGQFLVTGGGTATAPGLRYIAALGQTGAAVGLQDGAPMGSQIITSPRDGALVDGTLYADSASGTNYIVYYGTPGAFTPTSGQNTTTLPGLTGITQPLGLLVLDAGNTGSANLIYLADQTNGLEKFALVGGSWTAEGTIAGSFSGLTGNFDGTNVDLYATTGSGAAANSLVKLVDASGPTGTLSGTPTTLATAGSGSVFRGVALAPALTATTTTLTSSPNPSGTATGHNSVTYTATVAAATGTPTGTVNFYDAGVLVGTATLSTVGGNQVATFSTSYTTAGPHSLIAVYLGGGTTFALSDSAALTQTVIAPPTVTGVVVNADNAALAGPQRSLVSSLVYTFSEPVTLAAGAFTIALHPNVKVNGVLMPGGYGTLPTVGFAGSNGNKTWTVTFSGNGVVNGSIADGIYDLTLLSAMVSDAAGQALAADRVDTFYRLFGDSDGNRKVNNLDLAAFSGSFGKRSTEAGYLAYFDYDGNGVVNNADLAQFSARFNTSFSGF